VAGEARPLVEVRGLKKHFVKGRDIRGRPTRVLRAVDGVNFHIRKGETFGLVGESGSGKSTVGRCMLRLYDYTDGEVRFDGQDLSRLGDKQLKPYRRRIQSIFQDPYSSLNPGMNVLELVGEPMNIHGLYPDKEERAEAIADLLEKVGLKRDDLYRYPHEFSGGQRQRISIARALSVRPEFVICDEPTCSKICRTSSGSPICSSRMTWRWFGISRTGSASCTAAAWSRWRTATSCTTIRSIPTRRRCSRPYRCRTRGRRSGGFIMSRMIGRANRRSSGK